MRIVLDSGDGERELAIACDGPDITVAEVLATIGVHGLTAVHVDGRRVPTHHTVAEAAICDGATVALHPTSSGSSALTTVATVASLATARTVPRLAVVAGTGAGRSVPLDRPVVVGRDPGCDLVVACDTVAARHCRVVPDPAGGVVVTDQSGVAGVGSPAGTWVGGRPVGDGPTRAAVGELVRLGAVVLRVDPAPPDDRPRDLDPLRHLTERAGLPFNRPPRPGPPPPVASVHLPTPAAPVPEAPPFSTAALLAPLVLGAVMVVVLGSWRYALFMALSPVLLLASTLGGRRRAARGARAAAAAEREDLARFEREVAAAAAAERARRWELLPSVAEVCRRAEAPSTRLWERRPGHDDLLRLHVGVGAVPWQPPVASAEGGVTPDGLRTTPPGGGPGGAPGGGAAVTLLRWSRLPRSPVAVDLADGGVVGIAGDRGAAVALARSLLLQACVHHGPADLPVALVTTEDGVGDWDWATWLPHTATPGGDRRLAATADDGRALLAALRDQGAERESSLLVVLDAPAHLQGRDADARAVLRGAAGPVAGIVLAPSVDQLPAVCDTVVEVAGTAARWSRPGERVVVDDVVLAGLDARTCRVAARRLAGLEDPELGDAASDLPDRIDLLDLLAGDATDPAAVAATWQRTAGTSALTTPIGVGPEGTVLLDLVADGPHGLLGGTTGSGKSELLRTLVAGLAANHGPDHLTFLLVDYKGGAAFDACADLPHVVGLVTDLDEHLGERALRCLEAELGHRERRLRAAGVSDLGGWLRLPSDERGDPLPRLVVVVDEFATLRAELPDFVTSLVGVAQRGRSLGVHLLLGTQRPSGAVDENVRANANLRIALRMTDEHDSSDVIGVPDAAAVPPSLPGRGLLRTGPRAPEPLQTALVTGSGGRRGPTVSVTPVGIGPAGIGPVGGGSARAPAGAGSGQAPAGDDAVPEEGPSDLARLVAAARAAADLAGLPPRRRPWPDPLPAELDLTDLTDFAERTGAPGRRVDGEVVLGLLDDPDGQQQVPAGWQPRRGHLLVHGAVDSGTTTTLLTAALAAARTHDPDDLHLHVLDLGRGELAPLADLPHCGAVVTAREPERRQRLLAWLLAEADRRRGLDHAGLAATPLHLLVVDGLVTWLDELDTPEAYATHEAVQRLLLDGPALRMALVASVPRPGAVRTSVVGAVEQHLVHRLADPSELALLGLRPSQVPELPPGRAVRPGDGRLLQVARVRDVAAAVAAVAAVAAPATHPPAAVRSLPDRVGPEDPGAGLSVGDGGARWAVPLGLDVVTLEPVGWTLHPGEHALVLGSPASGRTSLLAGLAAVAAASGDRVDVVAVGEGLRRDGVRSVAPDELGQVLAEAAASRRPTLVLVDDAERVPDPGLERLEGVLEAPVRVVTAARQEALEGDYGHWLRGVARSRVGALLCPSGDVPADLLGARVPRRPPAGVRPGRGWVVSRGEATFAQVVTA